MLIVFLVEVIMSIKWFNQINWDYSDLDSEYVYWLESRNLEASDENWYLFLEWFEEEFNENIVDSIV
jgi:hypothetical protein